MVRIVAAEWHGVLSLGCGGGGWLVAAVAVAFGWLLVWLVGGGGSWFQASVSSSGCIEAV